ncbi:hypothetical protein D4764_08G0000880 [Takifugu flavidus]|uniref:Uncharacterized protein n=1 Tax=Takifugu flavidus TaxID=433684 RepID=A0A5C6MPG0_9TELE|nr:hypothetical protein D4764_08G0000880 [Takifugu flavidus]
MFWRLEYFFLCFAVLGLFAAPISCAEKRSGIVYTRDQLMALRPPSFVVGEKPQIPKEVRRKQRGTKAGVKQRMKRQRFKPCVPAVITGNVRSLANKMDELEALTRTQREYREASIMCFTETWLHGLIPDSNVTIAGFTTVRADRDTTAAGKKKGGGLAVFVSNRWCSPEHIHVKERVCSPDVELIAIGLRPYYLPREFTNVIAITVYIPPTGKADSACDVIHSVTADLQTKHPGAFILITGKSDHNLVLLSPSYTPVVQQQPVTVRTVMKWSDGAMDCLRDALETTNWSALCEPHGEDLDGLTDCVSDYIKFCTENSVPTKKVRCYPNNKPWVTSDLKALLNKKKRAFTAGDPAELRSVQKELKRSLKESKDAYRKKLEERLERNQTRDVWSGMRTITGFQKKGIRSADGNVDQANELNQFFNRLWDWVEQSRNAEQFPAGRSDRERLTGDEADDVAEQTGDEQQRSWGQAEKSGPVSRKQKLDEALVDMIVKDGQPFSIIEDEGFQNFIKILDPSYSIPSRKTVKAMVEARYTVAKEKALAESRN